MILIQSILRVVFSREKELYTTESEYEVKFLRNILQKCVAYYTNKYGEKINSLFREDEVFDDIIKYLLVTFGNTMLYRSTSEI